MRTNAARAAAAITGTLVFDEPQTEATVPNQIPTYGMVYTPQGKYLTSNPDLVGKYVAVPIWYPGTNQIVAGDASR